MRPIIGKGCRTPMAAGKGGGGGPTGPPPLDRRPLPPWAHRRRRRRPLLVRRHAERERFVAVEERGTVPRDRLESVLLVRAEGLSDRRVIDRPVDLDLRLLDPVGRERVQQDDRVTARPSCWRRCSAASAACRGRRGRRPACGRRRGPDRWTRCVVPPVEVVVVENPGGIENGSRAGRTRTGEGARLGVPVGSAVELLAGFRGEEDGNASSSPPPPSNLSSRNPTSSTPITIPPMRSMR